MIRSTKLSRSLILVLTILLLLLSLFLYISSSQAFLQPNNQLNAPDWFMQNGTGFDTNLDGSTEGSLTSQHLVHHPNTDQTNMDHPFFVLYDDQKIPWHIHAIHGLADQKKPEKLTLWQQVDIRQLPGKDSKETHITTHKMIYDPNSRIAHTDQPVVVTQNDGSTVHAIGMEVNLKTSKIHFLSKTEIEYHDQQT